MPIKKFHHKKLPDFSTLLCGKIPPDEIVFKTEDLQILYNNTAKPWQDVAPHYHKDSEECFVILKGAIIVEVENELVKIGEREFCYFPRGVVHSIVKTFPPIESLMIRSASIDDKVYVKKINTTQDNPIVS